MSCSCVLSLVVVVAAVDVVVVVVDLVSQTSCILRKSQNPHFRWTL